MTTQGDFITRARSRLDEDTARQWSEQDLRAWINEGARQIARKTEALEDRQTIAAVVSQSEYTLASDAIRIHRVEFTPTSEDTVKLEYVDVKQLDNFGWNDRTRTDNNPYIYTVWGSGATLKLITFPSPATAGNFTTWYYRLPVSLSETGNTQRNSTVEIPQGWDDVLLDYIEWRALRKDRDPRWQDAKAVFDESMDTMYNMTRRWVDESGMILPDSSGLPAWLVGG
jgi:hypothetical protein